MIKFEGRVPCNDPKKKKSTNRIAYELFIRLEEAYVLFIHSHAKIIKKKEVIITYK